MRLSTVKKVDYSKERKRLLEYFFVKRDWPLWVDTTQFFAPNQIYDAELRGIYSHSDEMLYRAAARVINTLTMGVLDLGPDVCFYLTKKITVKELRILLYTARKLSRDIKLAVDSLYILDERREFFFAEYKMKLSPIPPPSGPSVLMLDLPAPALSSTSFRYMPIKYLIMLILNRLNLNDLLYLRLVSHAFRNLIDITASFGLEMCVFSKYIEAPLWFEQPVSSTLNHSQEDRFILPVNSRLKKARYMTELPIVHGYLGKYAQTNGKLTVRPIDSSLLTLFKDENPIERLFPHNKYLNTLDRFELTFLDRFLFSWIRNKHKNTQCLAWLKEHNDRISNANISVKERFSNLVDFFLEELKRKDTNREAMTEEEFYGCLLDTSKKPKKLNDLNDPFIIVAIRQSMKHYLELGFTHEDSLYRAYKECVLGVVKYIPVGRYGITDLFDDCEYNDTTLDEFFLQLGKIDIFVAIALAVSIHVWELRPDQVSNKTLGELIRYYCDKHSKQFRKIYPGDQLALLEFHDLMTAYINVRAWSMSRETVLEWSQIHPLVFGQLLLHPPFQLFLHEGEIVLECEQEELLHSPFQLEKSNVMGYLTTSFDKKPQDNEKESYPPKTYADFCLFHHLSEEAIKQSFYLANGTIGSRLVSIETQEMFKQRGIELIGWQERPESFYQDSPRPATIPSEPQGSSETVLTEKNRSSRWGYLTLLLLCGLGFSLVGGGAWSLAGHPGLVMAGLLIHKLAFTVGSACAVILGGLLLFAALYLGLRLLRRGNASNEHKSHSYNSYQQFYQQELTAPSQAINTETHTETHGIESREDFKRVVSMELRPKKATGQASISLDSETGPSAELPQYH